jgi:hypothetical protein
MSLFYSAEQIYSANELQQGHLTLKRKVSGKAPSCTLPTKVPF